MGKVDTGKNFESEVRKSLNDVDCFWFRIQDTNDVSRFVKQAIAEKQPGDFMMIKSGVPVLIECKTSKRETSFPLYYNKKRAIPIHQVDAALEVREHGGESYFLLRRDKPRHKRCFAVKPQDIKDFYDTPKKSVKWVEIEKVATELPAISKPLRWDLRPILI